MSSRPNHRVVHRAVIGQLNLFFTAIRRLCAGNNGPTSTA